MSHTSDAKEAGSAPFGSTHTGAAAPSPGVTGQPAAMPGEQLGLDDMLPAAILEPARKGAGRPKGAANIRTNKTFQAAISRYGDPLIATIAWGNMDPRTLITELRKIASDCGIKLGATVMDVVRFQEQCRSAAMPYGHGKRVATDDKGDAVLPVFVLGGSAGSTTNVQVNAGGASALEARIEAERHAKQNQSVSAHAGEKSHGEKSHDE